MKNTKNQQSEHHNHKEKDVVTLEEEMTLDQETEGHEMALGPETTGHEIILDQEMTDQEIVLGAETIDPEIVSDQEMTDQENHEVDLEEAVDLDATVTDEILAEKTKETTLDQETTNQGIVLEIKTEKA